MKQTHLLDPSASAEPRILGDGRAVAVVALLVLGIVNVVWFNAFNFHSIMGDDLYAWAFYQGHPSFHALFLTASGGKYRPVLTVFQWVLFRRFSADYQAWVAFNATLNFVIVCLVFALVRRLTSGDTIISFFAGLLYITSRFAYYNVLQLMGLMEALCILLLVLIMLVALQWLREDQRWPGFALAGLFLLITLTHERYVALFPFLVLVVLFKTGVRWRLRGILLALICVPPLLNVVLKRFVFGTAVLMGTGGQALGFQPVEIAKYLVKGLANMFWINWGPDYLSGITMSEVGPRARVVVIVVALVLVTIVVLTIVRIARLHDRRARIAEVKGAILWLALFLPLLLASSITIRQEYRWLYAPFVVCLVYFSYQVYRLPGRAVVKYVAIAVLCTLMVSADYYYRQHEGNVFFLYGERVADAAYGVTVGHYGSSMGQRTVYVETRPDMQWILGGTLFLSPYLGLEHQKIDWVGSFASVDRRRANARTSLFLKVDPATGVLYDATRQVLAH